MKTQKYFKQVMMTAAVVLVAGNLSSCKDQDFDWDAAHANDAQKKFTNVFIEAFGEPETGHQWGFDMPWNKENGTRSIDNYGYSEEGNSLIIVKPENVGAGPTEWSYIDKYGTVPYITDQEHHDVYQWFSTHKVTWENTTTKIGNPNSDDGYTYELLKKEGDKYVDITNTYSNETTFEGKVIKKKTGEPNQVFEGTITVDGGSNPGLLVKIVYNDEWNKSTRNASGGAIAYWDGKDMDNNKLKQAYKNTNLNVGMVINFEFAWIQHVASTKYDNNVDTTWTSKSWDETTVDGITRNYSSNEMNYMHIYPATGSQGHSENFNYGSGPGYNWSESQNKPETQNMGVMALGANLNQLKYYNSVDSHYHDKWIIVYLEGDGYAGWYLGFDLEGGKEVDASGQYPANGYCNDWIIKLTSINPYIEKYPTNCRIMCEDLGGFNNVVEIKNDNRTLKSDIDYNDVVFDISSEDNNVIYITLHAAGGTLPLTIWYDNTKLFETHELFQEGAVRTSYTFYDGEKTKEISGDSPELDTPAYKIMYNTDNDTSSGTCRTIALLCNTSKTAKDIGEGIKAIRFYQDFSLDKLDIKVYRHSAQDYLDNKATESPADWLVITNYEGEAPLKICVPQEVGWLKEREAIDNGYPDFKKWVGDHSDYFWDTKKHTVNGDKLCSKHLDHNPTFDE